MRGEDRGTVTGMQNKWINLIIKKIRNRLRTSSCQLVLCKAKKVHRFCHCVKKQGFMGIPDSGINYIEDIFWAYLWQVTLEYHRWTFGIRMSPWRQPFLHGMCLGLISPCKSSDGWLVNFFIWTLCTLIIVDSCICNGKPSPWMGHLVTTTSQVPYITPASFWILHYDVS